MAGSDSIEFLFYGTQPSDWFTPDDGAFSYELRFTRSPDGAARRAIAFAFEHTAALEGVTCEDAWLWKGEWALLHVRRDHRAPDAASIPALFRAMQRVLLAIHGVVPLMQVVLLEAAGESRGDDGWERKTRDRREDPIKGPPWPRGGKRKPVPGLSTDPSFETARLEARIDVPKLRTTAEEVPSKPVAPPASTPAPTPSAPATSVSEPPPSGMELVVVPFAETEERISDQEKQLFKQSKCTARAANGALFGWLPTRGKGFVLGWMESGGRVVRSELYAENDQGLLVAHPEARGVWCLSNDGRSLRYVDCASKESVLIWKFPGGDASARGDKIETLALLSERLMAAITRDELFLLEISRGAATASLLGTFSSRRMSMPIAPPGEDVLLFLEGSDDVLVAWGFDGPQVRELARGTSGWRSLQLVQGRTPIAWDKKRVPYGVRGLRALRQAAFASGADPRKFPVIPRADLESHANSTSTDP